MVSDVIKKKLNLTKSGYQINGSYLNNCEILYYRTIGEYIVFIADCSTTGEKLKNGIYNVYGISNSTMKSITFSIELFEDDNIYEIIKQELEH